MANKIEWLGLSGETWNPITGCTPCSPGCANCYAARMAKRLAGRCGYSADDPFRVTFHPDKLDQPLRWRAPRRIFPCSMGDLFHEDVLNVEIYRMLAVMASTLRHRYMILTKRPDNMSAFFHRFNIPLQYWAAGELKGRISRPNPSIGATPPWPFRNVALGVTVCNQAEADEKIPLLLQTPAAMRWVSIEPMLGPIDLSHVYMVGGGAAVSVNPLTGARNNGDGMRMITGGPTAYPCLDLVVVGGETGPGARPMHPNWVRSIRDQCAAAKVPFFFKQWGEYGTRAYNCTTGEPVFRMYDSQQQWINKPQWINGGKCIDMHGRNLRIGGDFAEASYPVAIMHRVGKKHSGHLLDGREHHALPEGLRLEGE